MSQIKLKILTICLLWMFKSLQAQEIWRESFSNPGKGIQGSSADTLISDFTGISSWTLEYGKVHLENEGDYAKTVPTSGGRFEACDINGEVVWRSEWIPIAGYEKVYIELTSAETGSGANAETKYMKSFYLIDESGETEFNENGFNAGNWGSLQARQEGISGTRLQIVCYISTHYASDKVILDEVFVGAEQKFLPQVNPYEVVINEMMADPVPSVGLPEQEYIELFNTLSSAVKTDNWQLRINGVSKKLQTFIIEPEGYLILCATGALESLKPYGNVINVSGFQGLLNKGALVEILDGEGNIIDKIAYADTWYNNSTKEKGGWSLERIDPFRNCNQAGNWKASIHPDGGTPGSCNSVLAENKDESLPHLKWAVAVSEHEVELVFSEEMDSEPLTDIRNYAIDENKHPDIIELLGSGRVLLYFNLPFQQNKLFNLSIENLWDECGNTMIPCQVQVQWNDIKAGDVVINEILFNPFPGGDDFVEIYNPSRKLIDLNRLSLANRNKNNVNELNQVFQLTGERRILFPEEFLAVTTDTTSLFSWYTILCPSCFLQTDRMPSFPDSEGSAVLLNEQMQVLDELHYNEKMHSSFLSDTEGISLERISVSAPSNVKGNWHSASGDAGYATPGYKNSQAGMELTGKPIVTFEPDAFSPNYDGFNDEFIIRYETPDPGYIANIKLFDATGRFVQDLGKNEILGTCGNFVWNGRNKTGSRQPLGVYVVMVEIFNDRGDIHRFKKGVVLTDILE